MPEVNLLPDELRGSEEKELHAVHRMPKAERLEMSAPAKEDKTPAGLKTPKPSILSRLFSQKPKAATPPPAKVELAGIKTGEPLAKKPLSDVVLHLPPAETLSAKPTPNTFSGVILGSRENPVPPLVAKPEKKNDLIEEEKILKTAAKATPEKSPVVKPKKKSFFSGFNNLFRRKKTNKMKEGKNNKVEKPERIVDVNLIPQELAEAPELEVSKKLFTAGITVVAAILLVIGGYLGITWYQLKITQQIEGLQSELVTLTQQIVETEKGKTAATGLQNFLGVVNGLLNNHIYWTKFFTFLEKYTIDEVYYTNFSMAGQDKLVLSAVGKDYRSVAQQLVEFQQASDFIKSVRIDAASADIDQETGKYKGVSFNINLELLPNVFIKPIQ
ncbi:MAG: hypothetical protein WC768_04930 [Patescibacteria group bacterium]|jgi:hypothetical protein